MNKGFTIFFAVLVAGLTLSVGVVIYDILNRSLTLSQVAKQSQIAIYAADTGAECALYWDLKYNEVVPGDNDGSAFATSSTSGSAASGVTCTTLSTGASHDVSTNGTPPTPLTIPPTNWTAWSVTTNATAATTTFWIMMGYAATSSCAKVTVAKVGNPPETKVVSQGYNNCSTSAPLKLERSLQVNY